MYELTKQATESQLERILKDRLDDTTHIDASYRFFWESIQSVVQSGGKRVRPYLTMVGYGAFSDEIIPIATAWELIHIAMLIHDDIIDQDIMRHGKANINGIYLERYKKYLRQPLRNHYAQSIALLAGDALISESYRSIMNAQLPAAAKQRVAERLHKAIFEALGGELFDIEAPIFNNDYQIDPIIIYRYKTASYSFIGPLLSGADCRNAPADERRLLEQYAEAIGVGFQLQDDLLGLFGDEATTGKSTLTDLYEGKLTYLVAEHRRTMTDEQKRRFTQYFGNPQANLDQLNALKQDFVASGAKSRTEACITQYFDTATQSASALKNPVIKKELLALLQAFSKRSS